MTLQSIPTVKLQTVRAECREVLKLICQRVADHEQVTNGIRQLATADDVLAALLVIAQDDSEHAKLILHAAIAALVNIQSEMDIDAELKRRSDRN